MGKKQKLYNLWANISSDAQKIEYVLKNPKEFLKCQKKSA